MTTRRGRFTLARSRGLLAIAGSQRGGAKRAEARPGRKAATPTGNPVVIQVAGDVAHPLSLTARRVRQAASPDRSGQRSRWRRVAIRGRFPGRPPGEGGRSHRQRLARAGDGPLRRCRSSRRLSGRLRAGRARPGVHRSGHPSGRPPRRQAPFGQGRAIPGHRPGREEARALGQAGHRGSRSGGDERSRV